jgi:hypothetical protein
VISLFGNVSTPGSFTTASLNPRVTFPGGGANPNQSYGIAIGDLTGDGRPDIVFANNFSNNISIYQNVVPLTSGGLPPSITVEPVNQDAQVGGTTSFFVSARGSAMLTYQWFNGSGSILGATNSLLVLRNIQPSAAGAYYAVVSNPYGSTNSASATLTVNFPPATVQVVNTTPAPAGTNVVEVPINFVANGNENALNFSLNFDTNHLVYMAAVPGGGATLVANTSQVANGQLGIQTTLPGSGTFSPGTNQIMFVIFNTPTLTGTQVVTTTISFTSHPVGESLTDTNDNPLAFSLLSGTVTLSPGTNTSSSVVVNTAPTLNISSSGADTVLSWRASPGNFSLQAAGSLTPPVNWTNLPVTLETNGDNIQVTMPTSASQMFFRLYYP